MTMCPHMCVSYYTQDSMPKILQYKTHSIATRIQILSICVICTKQHPLTRLLIVNINTRGIQLVVGEDTQLLLQYHRLFDTLFLT